MFTMQAFLFVVSMAALPAERVVLIGDSQAAGLRSVGVLSSLGVEIHAFSGMTSQFFVQWLQRNPRAVENKSVVYFQLGGNDVTSGETLETIKLNVLLLVAITKQLSPDARVVFGAVPVRGQWFDALRKKDPADAARKERVFEALNAWLQNGPHQDFTAFSTAPVLSDPEVPRYMREEYRRRGAPDVHFNKRGYVALSTAVASLVLPHR